MVITEFSCYWYEKENDTIQPQKKDFINPTTKEDREYLYKVFYQNNTEVNNTEELEAKTKQRSAYITRINKG